MLDVNKIYTTEEFKTALGVGESMIEKMRVSGLPYVKMTEKSTRFFDGKAVRDWLVENYATDIKQEVAKYS